MFKLDWFQNQGLGMGSCKQTLKDQQNFTWSPIICLGYQARATSEICYNQVFYFTYLIGFSSSIFYSLL